MAFTAFSLRHEFEDHAAFLAVFEKRDGGFGKGWDDLGEGWDNESPEPKKFPGKIIALS